MMALKDVKPNSSGGKNKARFCNREDAKAGAKRVRREADRREAAEEPAPDKE